MPQPLKAEVKLLGSTNDVVHCQRQLFEKGLPFRRARLMKRCVERGIEVNLKCIPPVFLLLLEGQKPTGVTERQIERQATRPDFSRIRCPICKWQPKPAHRWFCASCKYPEFFDAGCGMCWNTFSTRGRCPGCGHQWRWTACLNCAQWSLHEHWYEKNSIK